MLSAVCARSYRTLVHGEGMRALPHVEDLLWALGFGESAAAVAHDNNIDGAFPFHGSFVR